MGGTPFANPWIRPWSGDEVTPNLKQNIELPYTNYMMEQFIMSPLRGRLPAGAGTPA